MMRKSPGFCFIYSEIQKKCCLIEICNPSQKIGGLPLKTPYGIDFLVITKDTAPQHIEQSKYDMLYFL